MGELVTHRAYTLNLADAAAMGPVRDVRGRSVLLAQIDGDHTTGAVRALLSIDGDTFHAPPAGAAVRTGPGLLRVETGGAPFYRLAVETTEADTTATVTEAAQ